MNDKLKVFSGDCCLCDVGIPTGEKNNQGTELYTGDIIQLWSGDYIETDMEMWTPTNGLTCVVSNQYQSYTDGSIEENPDPTFFVMGIRGLGFNDPTWKINIVKSHSHVIAGENWPEYGFSFNFIENNNETTPKFDFTCTTCGHSRMVVKHWTTLEGVYENKIPWCICPRCKYKEFKYPKKFGDVKNET